MQIFFFSPHLRLDQHIGKDDIHEEPQREMSTSTARCDGLETLKSTLSTTLDLISKLHASATPSKDTTDSGINAIDLAHDAASLVRAHTTKLSLLIINNPFTPSAVVRILRELMAGPLPALASAVELCVAGNYTKAMSEELKYRADVLFQRLDQFLGIIPLDGKIPSNDAKNGAAFVKGNGSLSATRNI